MESAYFFMFIALIFSVIFGVVIGGARWLSGTICSVTPISVIVGNYAMSPGNKLLETIAFASPFLIAVAAGYFTIGYAGATLGQRFKRGNSVAEQKAAFRWLGKRAGVIASIVIVWLLVSYILVHFMRIS